MTHPCYRRQCPRIILYAAMEEDKEEAGSYAVEGAVAPSLLLPQQRVDIQMCVLSRKEIRSGSPLGQIRSYPVALYGAMLRTGRH
jgi:hypothetical protein